MNNIKYANFLLIKNMRKIFYDRKSPGDIFAGMYMLTLISKDGFAGIDELNKLKEEDELEQLKKSIKNALKEHNEKQKIRNMIREALNQENKV